MSPMRSILLCLMLGGTGLAFGQSSVPVPVKANTTTNSVTVSAPGNTISAPAPDPADGGPLSPEHLALYQSLTKRLDDAHTALLVKEREMDKATIAFYQAQEAERVFQAQANLEWDKVRGDRTINPTTLHWVKPSPVPTKTADKAADKAGNKDSKSK